MDAVFLLSVAGVLICGLFTVIHTFFWNKLKSQDKAVEDLELRHSKHINDLSHNLAQTEKDINMAHNHISILKAEAATKVQLNDTVEKVRADIKGEFDRQEIRQEKREAGMREALDKIYDTIVDMAKKMRE